MSSPLPPDPYEALGVPKDASTAAVKSAHRKLVLKCHPDKVTDPALKQAAADKFHVIQSAYEILVDEDRRGRYDAQVRLAELRREALERKGSGDRDRRGYEGRPAPAQYRESFGQTARSGAFTREPDRVVPTYEERRPNSYSTDYFDAHPKATARKDAREYEPERPSRRPAHDGGRDKMHTTVKQAKDHMRAGRKEKERRTERDTRRDRDRKHQAAEVESDSEDDETARWQRNVREHDARRAAYEPERRYAQDAELADERAQKLRMQDDIARNYMQSSRTRGRPEAERRPSPVRVGSDRENGYSRRTAERPPMMPRQSSARPATSGYDAEPQRRPGRERRSSPEPDTHSRRPPPFASSKSSPVDIRIPAEKPRAQSLQHDAEALPKINHMRRADTMPYTKTEHTFPAKGSNLRTTEINDGMPTPGATPEYNGPSPAKYTYGKQYADDAEFVPTPDGFRPAAAAATAQDNYRTDTREPYTSSHSRPSYTRKMTSSPSPTREPRDTRDPRDKPRATSGRYETATAVPPRPSLAQQPRNGSTRHVYTYAREGETSGERRASTARASPREPQGPLFGEVRGEVRGEARPQVVDPPRRQHSLYSPVDEPVYNTREMRPGSGSRQASGYGAYSSKRGGDRQGVGRSGSGQPIHVR